MPSLIACSPSDAARFLKATAYRLEAALDAFYNDAPAVNAAAAHREAGSGGSTVKKLAKLWERYRGQLLLISPHPLQRLY